MSLGFQKRSTETFRECVIRYASPWGLEEECLREFDKELAAGVKEQDAAWNALYEWDVLDLYKDDEE